MATSAAMKLRERNDVQFLGVLFAADRGLALLWCGALLLRGALPAAFAVAMGGLVGAVSRGEDSGLPLVLAGAVFIGLQVLAPLISSPAAGYGWPESGAPIQAKRPSGELTVWATERS